MSVQGWIKGEMMPPNICWSGRSKPFSWRPKWTVKKKSVTSPQDVPKKELNIPNKKIRSIPSPQCWTDNWSSLRKAWFTQGIYIYKLLLCSPCNSLLAKVGFNYSFYDMAIVFDSFWSIHLFQICFHLVTSLEKQLNYIKLGCWFQHRQ